MSHVCVSLAICFARYFVVIVTKYDPASKTVEATGVELPALLRLHILTLDTTIAGSAKGSIQLMVVLFAIRCVIKNVEFGGGKWCLAGPTNEALFVIASSEAAG